MNRCGELTAKGAECRKPASVRVVHDRLHLVGLVCPAHARRLVESSTGWAIATT